jgi:hypothetical protein
MIGVVPDSLADVTSTAHSAIELLEEYTAKIKEIAATLRALRDESHTEKFRSMVASAKQEKSENLRRDFDFQQQHYQALRTPALKLSQYVSQMIEHSALDDLMRLKLRLKLAEFESLLTGVSTLIGTAKMS